MSVGSGTLSLAPCPYTQKSAMEKARDQFDTPLFSIGVLEVLRMDKSGHDG